MLGYIDTLDRDETRRLGLDTLTIDSKVLKEAVTALGPEKGNVYLTTSPNRLTMGRFFSGARVTVWANASSDQFDEEYMIDIETLRLIAKASKGEVELQVKDDRLITASFSANVVPARRVERERKGFAARLYHIPEGVRSVFKALHDTCGTSKVPFPMDVVTLTRSATNKHALWSTNGFAATYYDLESDSKSALGYCDPIPEHVVRVLMKAPRKCTHISFYGVSKRYVRCGNVNDPVTVEIEYDKPVEKDPFRRQGVYDVLQGYVEETTRGVLFELQAEELKQALKMLSAHRISEGVVFQYEGETVDLRRGYPDDFIDAKLQAKSLKSYLPEPLYRTAIFSSVYLEDITRNVPKGESLTVAMHPNPTGKPSAFLSGPLTWLLMPLTLPESKREFARV